MKESATGCTSGSPGRHLSCHARNSARPVTAGERGKWRTGARLWIQSASWSPSCCCCTSLTAGRDPYSSPFRSASSSEQADEMSCEFASSCWSAIQLQLHDRSLAMSLSPQVCEQEKHLPICTQTHSRSFEHVSFVRLPAFISAKGRLTSYRWITKSNESSLCSKK